LAAATQVVQPARKFHGLAFMASGFGNRNAADGLVRIHRLLSTPPIDQTPAAPRPREGPIPALPGVPTSADIDPAGNGASPSRGANRSFLLRPWDTGAGPPCHYCRAHASSECGPSASGKP